ncbi:hypothetical protein C1646_758224 [Rhizophagus diaphanus]|nr:hypothetical protein C1646_758224 [Rhizophagus diaphanus] [Rhizophagus sp. MUCL 43196]
MIECRLFYQLQYDNNIYYAICRKVQFNGSECSILTDNNYDYEFIFQSLNDSLITFHVTFKLLSRSLFVNILNKKIYGMDFNVTDSKSKLTLNQKLSLRQTLQQILPSYFSHMSDNEIETSDENNIYHITCKMILQDLKNCVSLDDNNYDYEFILDDSEMIFYVTCKLLSYSLILNLEQNLKQILASYFLQHPTTDRVDLNENLNSSHDESDVTIDNNWPQNDNNDFSISHQDDNGTEIDINTCQ